MGAARVLPWVAGTASRGKDFRATACIEKSLPSAWFHPLLRPLWITQAHVKRRRRRWAWPAPQAALFKPEVW